MGVRRLQSLREGRAYDDSQVSDLGNWETSGSSRQGEGADLSLGQGRFMGLESHVGGDAQGS